MALNQKYKIWSEGYRITGNFADAHYHGIAEGFDFIEACVNFAQQNPEFAKYYNSDNNTYWGCKLYDNEKAARKIYN